MRKSRTAAALIAITVFAVVGVLTLNGGSAAQGNEGAPAGPGCSDDPFENNDTQQSASPAPLPYNQAGLRVCPNDNDWYSFTLAQGAQVQIDALFSHSAGNVNIALFDPNGGFQAFSESQTDNEKITHTATMTGTYAVQVHLFANVPPAGNSYTLQIAQTGGSCSDDTWEDNDTYPTSPYVGLPFTFPNLRICPGDDDYFSFPLNAGDQVQVNVLFDHSFGDIDIELLNQPGNVVGNSATSTDNENIKYVAPTTDPYGVRVTLLGGVPATGNTYTIQITSTFVGPPTPTPILVTPILFGDVDCDGTVNSIDAALVLQYSAGLYPAFTLCAAPDANLDGAVNSIDAALILQYSAGLVGSLPPP